MKHACIYIHVYITYIYLVSTWPGSKHETRRKICPVNILSAGKGTDQQSKEVQEERMTMKNFHVWVFCFTAAVLFNSICFCCTWWLPRTFLEYNLYIFNHVDWSCIYLFLNCMNIHGQHIRILPPLVPLAPRAIAFNLNPKYYFTKNSWDFWRSTP